MCVLFFDKTHITGTNFLTITDLNDIEACTYVVKSWAWQLKQGVDTKVMRPAMRFIVQDEPSPILVTAAKNGFWSVPRSVLTSVAEMEKCSLAGCADMFDVLWVLVLHILKCPEKVAIDILEAKGAALHGAQTGVAELMARDEAQACLDDDDKEDFKTQRDVAKTEMLETDECSRAWVEKSIKVN